MNLIITIILVILFALTAFFLFRNIYSNRINRRILGDGKPVNLPSLSTILILIILAGSLVINVYIGFQKEYREIYEVQYVLNGGEGLTIQKVRSGDFLKVLEAPTKKEFTFEGWFKDAQLTKLWNMKLDVVDKNTTLYAKWWDNSQATFGLNYQINKDNESYSVVKGSTNPIGKVIIPQTYNNFPVTEIGDEAFINCREMNEIQLTDKIVSLGVHSFNNTGLIKINLPINLKVIKDYAFLRSENLKEVNVTDTIEFVGVKAFEETPWLNSSKDDLFYVGRVLHKYLRKDTNLVDIVNIRQDTISISPSAFEKKEYIKSVFLPSSLIEIGESAFLGCKNLVSINFPANLNSIQIQAFANCSNLKVIEFNESIQFVGYKAFYETEWLKNQQNSLKDNFVYIGKVLYAFFPSTISPSSSITIDKNIVAITDNAFENNQFLESIILPDSVKEIGGQAFLNCTALKNINELKNILKIGEEAFAFCENLKSITIGKNIIFVGARTFVFCNSLEKIFIRVGKYMSDGWSETWNYRCSAQIIWDYELI